ncbi:ATP-binding protein [Rufibacter aurantiacus]|uniref:ATP-binding protein n=1 Tax=Rufibacter aurantiacus TaxID=2817374 RepID=UPI001B302325|nr:ATP-binding protein [Rufibacter aurantiacus]
MKKRFSEELPPEPFSFIKSISEQGYSLSTALADLIDNSITADASRVEILSDVSSEPFRIFIADNGNGMTEQELHLNMRFPSNNPDNLRSSPDLGRFGLGMKTASFSQTRCFTVLSRSQGSAVYAARTWDVDYLRQTGNWSIIINTSEEIECLLQEYRNLSEEYIGHDKDFMPGTIIIWCGLYKIERLRNDMSFRKGALADELHDETADHLGMVFHRFLDSKTSRLTIRINNVLVNSFDPFPEKEPDLLALAGSFKIHEGDPVKIKGYVLPARSIKESKEGISVWTSGKRSLTDMEGIYVYRNGRLIISGGWNRLLKKSPQFQLGRLKVDIGNKLDALFHLNVSKSSLKIPFELKQAFLRAVAEIKEESYKEYRNRINNELIEKGKKAGAEPLLIKVITDKGAEYRINPEFSLIQEIEPHLDHSSHRLFNTLIRAVNNQLKLILGYEDNQGSRELNTVVDEETSKDIIAYMEMFQKKNYSKDRVLNTLYSIFRKEEVDIILNKKI